MCWCLRTETLNLCFQFRNSSLGLGSRDYIHGTGDYFGKHLFTFRCLGTQFANDFIR